MMADLVSDRARRGHSITVRVGFETAHRLPHLGGKCVNVHGHSWTAEVTIHATVLSPDTTVIEFGAVKSGLRAWIETYLDHATMLGATDSLMDAFIKDGTRVFRFGTEASAPETLAADLRWPTVEAVAVLLFRVARQTVAELSGAPGVRVDAVVVSETSANSARYPG